jgi:hypothetical protein
MELMSFKQTGINKEKYVHGRSGRVALPRTKLVLAMAATRLGAPARRAERAVMEVRKRVADMITFD